MQPFTVTLNCIGGSRGQFLLPASDQLAMLMKFRETLSAAITKAGLRIRPNIAFNPHMTLAYAFSDVAE
jgi:2'-5' RNA ligase